jgi:hypothetical protein
MKKIALIFASLVTFYLSILICKNFMNTCQEMKKVNSMLPFVGRKYFETRQGIAGTGTPAFTVNIDSNSNVYFTLLQISADDHVTEFSDTFQAGNYRHINFCNLAWEGFPRWYILKTDSIIEVDSIGNRLFLNEYCGLANINQKPCNCASNYY